MGRIITAMSSSGMTTRRTFFMLTSFPGARPQEVPPVK